MMALATHVPYQLARDLNATLAALRMARTVHPRHELLPGQVHKGCDICTGEDRLDWLLNHIPRREKV
jgi:hypothetical protein